MSKATQSPQSAALGQLGADFFNDTATHNGVWTRIYCVTDCTFATLTSGTLPDGVTLAMRGTLASIALKAGMTIFGVFTVIDLATGSVIAYE